MRQIRLVLADDHPLIIDGLVKLLESEADLEVIGTCRSGAEAVSTVLAHRPDILILDLQLGDMTGWDVIARLESEALPTQIIILTGSLPEERILDFVEIGVAGLVLKEAASTTLLRCIREISAGGKWIESGLAQKALQQMSERQAQDKRLGTLTSREKVIVRLVAEGFRNKEIARQLSITEGTVKIHVHNIYEKIGVGNRVELARFARQHGLE